MITIIQKLFIQYLPIFRVTWAITILLGIILVVVALILKKNPERKKSPWILGGIGTLMIISSGMQLLFSLI